MKHLAWFALLLGCSVPESSYPPVAGTGTCVGNCASATTTSESSSTSSVTECDAYIGCVKQCDAEDCVALCAKATSSDADTCEQVRCEVLTDACARGDEQACKDVLSCVHSDSSSTSETTSSSSGSSSTSESSDATTEDSSSSEGSGTSDSTSSTG
jgi:hypothetical protein